jgi:hypothetical protein
MAQKNTVLMPMITILAIFWFFSAYAANQESSYLIFEGTTLKANLKDESFKNIFQKLQKETGIWFSVSKAELDAKVSVRFENLSIEKGLRRILHAMNYSFLFDQNNNVIGVFVFGKANRNRRATDWAELNDQMARAIMAGDTAAAVEFLSQGADVNAKGKYSGWTPLMLAAKKGNTELVKLLLSHGADINARSGVRNRTAIMEAARNRNVETVKALLTANTDIDAADWEGYTVLMFAAISGQSAIVDELVTYGADVNVKNKTGHSALVMASGYPDVYKKLEAAGAEQW